LSQTHFNTSTKKIEQPISHSSYSGDKPNSNLKAFVEKHVAEHPYNPLTDNYDVKAFDKPIQTTKATAIYNMHTYWSKKPHDAIIQYIEHYTKPGDLVLDPMCGSGSTALAALMTGRKVVAIDLSPAATFITKNYCTPVDVRELEKAFHELETVIRPEMDWLYETRCDRCGGKATTQYTVYSKVFQCPRCLEKVPLFDCVETEVAAKVQKSGQPAKMKKVSVCPYCLKIGHVEEISTRSEKFGSIPVLVSYECQDKCKPMRGERRYNDSDPKKREYFEKYDLGKIREIDSKDIHYWYPKNRMMNVESDTEPWGDKWRAGTSNFRTVDELFTKRNLWALALIRENSLNSKYKDSLLFTLTGSIHHCSKMATHKETGGGYMIGTYYLPQIYKERNVMNTLQRKFHYLITAFDNEKKYSDNNLIVSTDDACNLNDISSNSVDYVFTDPPYGGNVQYGELNFVWEAWLGFNTYWHKKEIIINETRGVTEEDWRFMMKQAMTECQRVLKPSRWISLCYHDTDPKTWQLIQDLMTEVGFIPDRTQNAIYIDASQKSYNQLTADKVTKRDLVINFHKPKVGETSAIILLTDEEDSTTFNEKAGIIIRDFLSRYPGSTKDRVYDELISKMVQRGQLQSHIFNDIIRQVAEPTKTQNGAGFIERWYLKGTELEVVDIAESEKEEQAADLIRKFIEDYLMMHIELEGVHYSDIFEHYIYTVKDKPRRELFDWLLDYFYLTGEGTYRLPQTAEEERVKAEGRSRGMNRTIRRYIAFINHNVPIPEDEKPDNASLFDWVLHCRRSGLFSEGKLLYERGGLVLDEFGEQELVELDEAYQVCVKMVHE
jgi:DNA modification methylase